MTISQELRERKLFMDHAGKRGMVAIFPSPLSIVDCYSVFSCANKLAEGNSAWTRIADEGHQVETVEIKDAFDLCGLDRDGQDVEFALHHGSAKLSLYWDRMARFVSVIVGDPAAFEILRPFPEEIEAHRFEDEMGHLERAKPPEDPASLYAELKALISSAAAGHEKPGIS